MPSVDDLMKEAHDIIDDVFADDIIDDVFADDIIDDVFEPTIDKDVDWGFDEIKIDFEGIDEDKFKEKFIGIWENEECLHRQCSECNGSGVKKDGSACVHYISCPCKQCTPWC